MRGEDENGCFTRASKYHICSFPAGLQDICLPHPPSGRPGVQGRRHLLGGRPLVVLLVPVDELEVPLVLGLGKDKYVHKRGPSFKQNAWSLLLFRRDPLQRRYKHPRTISQIARAASQSLVTQHVLCGVFVWHGCARCSRVSP